MYADDGVAYSGCMHVVHGLGGYVCRDREIAGGDADKADLAEEECQVTGYTTRFPRGLYVYYKVLHATTYC